MAYFRTGGGGALNETVLWTNSSPTSSMATSTTRTISGNFSDYKQVKISWRLAINNAKTNFIIVPIDEFKEMRNDNGYNEIFLGARGSSAVYMRDVFYMNDTTFGNGSCFQRGTSTQNNAFCIITEISGLK